MKMKKLLKNAVVYAIAASMLFATPLTASAGLIDAYKVEDGWGDIVGDDDGGPTGTITNTSSETEPLRDYDANIIGIALDQEYVTVEQGKNATLKATVVIDGLDEDKIPADVLAEVNSLIRWETSDRDKVSIELKDGDRTEVSLYAREGTALGKEVEITASIGGNFTYTWTDKDNNQHTVGRKTSTIPYEKAAKVFVKEYATDVTLSGYDEQQYVNHKLDMKDYLTVQSATANDTITWSVVPTVNGSATITADGVVTFKKADEEVTVWAVSERGVKDFATFSVTKGIGASKVVIYNDDAEEEETTFAGNKTTAEIVDGALHVSAVMFAKVDTKDGKKELPQDEPYEDSKGESRTVEINDVVTWTSNKSNIVKVDYDGDGSSATLTPLAVGTAKITAKTTSGKTAFVNVTVKAALGELRITTDETTLYSSQKLQLEYERDPKENKDAVKWEIEKVAKDSSYVGDVKDLPANQTKANPNASINAKGVLTIKNKTYSEYPVRVRVLTTKAVETTKSDEKEVVYSDWVEFDVEQSSITSITIKDGDKPIAKSDYQKANQVKNPDNTVKLSVPKSGTYTAYVEGTGGADALTWTSNKPKVASIVSIDDGTATIKAEGKGTATITVSGLYTKYKDDEKTIQTTKVVKTTFKVDVKQPVTSLTMNKSSVVLKYAADNKGNAKKQTVSLNVKANKNAVMNIDSWDMTQVAGAGAAITNKSANAKGLYTKAGKFELTAYKPGDEFVVTAMDKSGATATATIKIVTTSTDVTIWKTDKDEEFSYLNAKGNPVKKAVKLGIGESVTLRPMVNVGYKNTNEAKQQAPDWVEPGDNGVKYTDRVAAGVTYTVNKKGFVTIEGNTVRRVKAGSVTVTVKTEDGKSYKLKID